MARAGRTNRGLERPLQPPGGAPDFAAKIRVLLIEDQPIFRLGVRLILAETPDIAVVGEVATGEEGLRLLERLPGGDVVITDLVLPGRGGLDVARRAKEARAAPRVLLLTMRTGDEDIRGMIAAEADGYVLKQGPVGGCSRRSAPSRAARPPSRRSWRGG